MILARITHAIRTQNWFAVVLEFVIVIAGVVIGFQVTEWNAERADRAIIADQLGEVREDLIEDIASLEITRDASLWRFTAAEFILEQAAVSDSLPDLVQVFAYPLDRGQLPIVSLEDHPTLLARVNLIRGITGQRTGYESLVSAGNIRLIQNRELRVAIQRYYAGYEDLQNNLTIFREIRAPAIPVLYRHGFSMFSEQELDRVLEAVRSDAELMAYIHTARELAMAQSGIVIDRDEQAAALLELIEAELAQ